MRLKVLLLLSASVLCLQWPAAAEGKGPCAVAGGLDSASATCQWAYIDYAESASSGDGHTWVVTIQCANGGICADQVECIEGGDEGFMHDVYMDGIDVGDVCVPQAEVAEVNITQLIIREFRRIAWPSSKLVVQPPGGKTLVNFETNYFTRDSVAISQEVTVAGKQVTIRALPTTYTFNFGDETSVASATPGRPHPDLDITHVYARTGDVVVRLDTTYAGEYRIGGGDWVAIPETLTVTGADEALEIVEALPQLVIR